MKVKVWIETRKVGSECSEVVEFNDEEWNGWTDEQREAVMRDAAFEYIDWGFEVVS